MCWMRRQLQPEAWPQPQKISFGRVIAPRVGGDAAMIDQSDTMVEGAYTTRLWKND